MNVLQWQAAEDWKSLRERRRRVSIQERSTNMSLSRRASSRRSRAGGPDTMKTYLKEIGHYKLLNSEKEISLAQSIQTLLRLERVRNELQNTIQRPPSLQEWAREAEVSVER